MSETMSHTKQIGFASMKFKTEVKELMIQVRTLVPQVVNVLRSAAVEEAKIRALTNIPLENLLFYLEELRKLLTTRENNG